MSATPAPGTDPGAGPRFLPVLLAAVVLLAHPQAALPGLTYFYRDFTITYYPLRAFFAREVARGSGAFWNPYVQEGTFALPAFYPGDLLNVLWPGPAAVSWLLTLHIPLAALTFYWLARDLGARRWGAFLGGAAYALGGFALSCVNLYILLQALALAPLVVLGCRRAALRGGRAVVLPALALGASLSTSGVEFVAQALLLGLVLGAVAAPGWRAARRLALATALGFGLAAVPVAVTLGMLRECVRGAGFSPEEALAYSVHPVVLLQAVIPGLFGSLARPLQLWWGGDIAPGTLPYFMSVYVGALVLAVAWAGAPALAPGTRRALLALAAAAVWFALGPWGGLAPALMSLPGLHWLRYPSKALLIPYLAVSLLAAVGYDRLREGDGWRRFAVGAGALGAVALGVGLAVRGAGPAIARALAIHPGAVGAMRLHVGLESAEVVLLVLLGLALAGAVGARWLAPSAGAGLLLVAVVADLMRAGVGLTTQVPVAFFQPLPELAALHLDALDGGRVFTYEPAPSPGYLRFLESRRPGAEVWAYFLARQMLGPYTNLLDRVELAESGDRRGFTLHPLGISQDERAPGRVGEILGRLRNAAVTRILSLDPLDHPDLRLLATFPVGVAGFEIHAYELLRPWPRAYVACGVLRAPTREAALSMPLQQGFDPSRDVALEGPGAAACGEGHVRRTHSVPGEDAYDVTSDGPGFLVTRDSYARGWTATVDGHPAPVVRANGKHRAVSVPPGRHQVVMRYLPPGLRAGLALTGLSSAVVLWLLFRPLPDGERVGSGDHATGGGA